MKQKMNISLDEEVVMLLKELAKQTFRSPSQWITDRILEYAEAQKTEPAITETVPKKDI